MSHRKNNFKNRQKYRKTLALSFVGVLLVSAIILGAYIYSKNRTPIVANENSTQTTSTQATAQNDFSEGGNREAKTGEDKSQSSINVEDTLGNDAGVAHSDSITSKTGEITVYSPREGDSVTNELTLSGESSLKFVNYRLINNESGLVASGRLDVVNGKFSAKLKITPEAQQGRLDIFGSRNDLSEFSNISIGLYFKR
jgi:cytoskeletal protein RodZ